MTRPHLSFEPISVFNHLGHMPVAEFLERHWHRTPCIFRQAMTCPPLASIEDILDLCKHEDVESRLISCFKQRWTMSHGPFDKLPARSRKNWTVLIQGLNLHWPAAHQLLEKFRFVPDARLDDLMVSFATDGGGVGAHFDSYDVFLLQMHGQRRWRIGAQSDLALDETLPLKILKNFSPSAEYILEPGDMLYLPPCYAHEGTALGECTTLSIGFRAPTAAETLGAVLRHWADHLEADAQLQTVRFADPGRGLLTRQEPASLPCDLIDWVMAQLSEQICTPRTVAQGLTQYLTEPKENIYFESPQNALSEKKFLNTIKYSGLILSKRSKMLYSQGRFFINGEYIDQKLDKFHELIQTLANQHGLTAQQCSTLCGHVALIGWLYDLYQAGWIELPVI